MDAILEQVFRSAEAGSLGSWLPWKANALRHSFISYRLAKTKDIAAVALEAGNSPRMIFAHYRELCTESEAADWFGIVRANCGRPPESNGSPMLWRLLYPAIGLS